MNRIKIVGANLISPIREISQGQIVIEDGVITEAGKYEWTADKADVIDASGLYAAPGFIDIHTHGGGGYEYMNCTKEAFAKAARTHLEHGTTTVLPTSVACTDEQLFSFFDIYEQVKNDGDFTHANMPGVHLEGPYFSKLKKGAHVEELIILPTREHFMKVLEKCPDILRISSAPEIEGALEMSRELRKRNIVSAIAHTDAGYEDVLKAVENGYTLVTHFYNAMSSMKKVNSYKFPGVVESGYMIDELFVEVIADGNHVPPEILRMMYRHFGAGRMILISDSMSVAGLADENTYMEGNLGRHKYIIEGGVAKLADRSAFAGSIMTGDKLVRNIQRFTGASLCDAVKMMTYTPARVMGLKSKGLLNPGMDGDVVLFDRDVNIKMVVNGGQVVYRKN